MENLNFKKEILPCLIGWILLIVGLIIIFWTIIYSYNIFFQKSEIIEIFKVEEERKEGEKNSIVSDYSSLINFAGIEEEVEKIIAEQVEQFLPSEFILKTFNLIAWSILAFILIFAGSQISNLGIKLIKK